MKIFRMVLIIVLSLMFMYAGGFYAKRTFKNVYDAEYYGAGISFITLASLAAFTIIWSE